MKEILRATGNVQQAWEATNLEKIRASLNLGIAQQNLSAVQATEETQVRSLGQEDPPEEDNGNPLQYSCQRNLKDRGAWRVQSKGSQDTTKRLNHHQVGERFTHNYPNKRTEWNIPCCVWIYKGEIYTLRGLVFSTEN